MLGERNGKGGQGASVPSEPDPTAGELVPVFVVPQVCGSSPRDSHLTSDQAMLAQQGYQRPQCSPKRHHADRIPLGEPGHEAVQEGIERAWRPHGGTLSPRGAGGLGHPRTPQRC